MQIYCFECFQGLAPSQMAAVLTHSVTQTLMNRTYTKKSSWMPEATIAGIFSIKGLARQGQANCSSHLLYSPSEHAQPLAMSCFTSTPEAASRNRTVNTVPFHAPCMSMGVARFLDLT